jgi:Rrf2 family protein
MMFATISSESPVWLSSTAQQAIDAVLCIAGADHDGPVRGDHIARAIQCPRNYLSKTLTLLVREGILRSERGPRGGFRLAIAADSLTVARVIAPFAQPSERHCLLGRAGCDDGSICAARPEWSKVTGGVDDFLRPTTIAGVLRGHPNAATQAREGTRVVVHSNQSRSHGSIA